jgi:hypothetical protein
MDPQAHLVPLPQVCVTCHSDHSGFGHPPLKSQYCLGLMAPASLLLGPEAVSSVQWCTWELMGF